MKQVIINLYQFILGFITILALLVNTIAIFIPVFVVGLIKLIPLSFTRKLCNKVLGFLCSVWIDFNTYFIKFTRRIKWNVKGNLTISRKDWYLVVSNHQSWLDIVVLQKVLHRRIPELKFFIKDQLKWIPLLGFAWWVFDHPFMKRFSKDYLQKNPDKIGKDLATTKKACKKFDKHPVSIMNFIEGTRYTPLKHAQQESPYRSLLKPKAGGVAYVLHSMGEKIHSIIDVTIAYPDNKISLWDYLSGRIKEINIYIRQLPIPERFICMNYFEDPHIRFSFQTWLNEKWNEKDAIYQYESQLLLGKSS